MHDPDLLRRACDAAAHAARDAGTLIRQHAGRLHVDAVSYKAAHDLVTDVDRAAQRVVIDHLADAFPSFDVLAEEEGVGAGTAQHAEGYRWIIDPIDGTTNFTRGIPPYAVSIGLQHGDEVVVGVVYEVANDELFAAYRGGGLRVNGIPAGVTETDELAASIVATGFPYRAIDHLDAYMAILREILSRTNGHRRLGAASVDLAYLACGRLDVFYETSLAPWDIAAGLCLVTEGGGRLTTFRGGGDVLFAPNLLATNGPLHEPMLELLGTASWGD